MPSFSEQKTAVQTEYQLKHNSYRALKVFCSFTKRCDFYHDDHVWRHVPVCRETLSGSCVMGHCKPQRSLPTSSTVPEIHSEAASITVRTDYYPSRSGCLLTYELDFCIQWLEWLPGSQQHPEMVLQSLGIDLGLQRHWYVLLQLFPVPKSRQ